MSEIIRLENIRKSFDSVKVLDGFSLSVNKGEFISLLGASGCGKTTILRLIAGLEQADEGRIFIDGKDVTLLKPDKRKVNMVFQNYALFPFMNVEENVGYSLKIKKTEKNKISEEVREALRMVRLSGYEKRMPSQLSGGQKQRVAIARAIVNKSDILLLDEPLSALDAGLRQQMQTELKQLQRELGITFVYITHDQEEALNMSDRIVVMNKGRIEQIGKPEEIYYRPDTVYVAEFVGKANILKGKITDPEHVKLMDTEVPVHTGKFSGETFIAVRSEHVKVSEEKIPNGVSGKVISKIFVVGMEKLTIELTDKNNNTVLIESRQPEYKNISEGDSVYVYWEEGKATAVKEAGV